jgi:hypothetical protein
VAYSASRPQAKAAVKKDEVATKMDEDALAEIRSQLQHVEQTKAQEVASRLAPWILHLLHLGHRILHLARCTRLSGATRVQVGLINDAIHQLEDHVNSSAASTASTVRAFPQPHRRIPAASPQPYRSLMA